MISIQIQYDYVLPFLLIKLKDNKDLPEHVFSHGQLYVTLSKGISMATTKMLVKSKECFTKNIVYKNVLTL